MESIGKAHLRGVYKDGVIRTDDFSIRVPAAFPAIKDESVFVGDVYLDALDRPYFVFETELPNSTEKDSFISILMTLDSREQIQKVLLHDCQEIWVDFRNITDRLNGYYYCSLEYRLGTWYFVPKGVDSTTKEY